MKKTVLPILVFGALTCGIVACKSTEKTETQSTSTMEEKTIKKPQPEVTFYPSGAVKISGKYNKNGERQGLWSSWFESGVLRSEAFYQNDKRNGEYKVWYENEQPKIEGFFTNEEPSGIWNLYDSTGTLINKVEYKDGKPVELPIN